MRLMIASDIHGSAKFANMMIDAFKQEEADRLLILGDILYHGPRNDLPEGHDPKAVLALLNQYKDVILAVRGNCDAEVDQMVLQFPMMADYAVLSMDDLTIYATHGHHYNIDNLPPHKDGDILLCGHTHVPACIDKDGMTYINPGSTSLPKENSKNSYMIYDKGEFVWKDMDGNIYKTYLAKAE